MRAMKRAGEEGKKMEGDPNARREAGMLHDLIILIIIPIHIDPINSHIFFNLTSLTMI